MTPKDPNASPLTEHFSWLERLATQLVRDPDDAGDLVQDTWVAALRMPHHEVREPRGLLRRLLTRAISRRARSERRRRDHEALAHTEVHWDERDQLVERAELGRELTRLVLELDDPYRETVLLRYAEDLTPTEIARRTSTPLATVKSRLARAKAMLRDRWDEDHPGSREWLSSLALAVPAVRRVPPAIAGGSSFTLYALVAMKTKLLLAAGGALAFGAVLWFQTTDPQSTVRPQAGDLVMGSDDTERIALPRPQEPIAPVEETSRTAADTTNEPSTRQPTAPHEEAALRMYRGRVIDLAERPVAQIDVALTRGGREAARATTGLDGRFEIEAAPGVGEIQAVEPDLVNLFVHRTEATGELDALLVVAPFRTLGGTVTAPDGSPVRDALVELVPPPGFRGRFDAVLDAASIERSAGTTDEFGRFLLERAPILDGSTVRATVDGFPPAAVPAPPVEARNLALVLQRSDAEENTLAGRVIDGRGVPVQGALVSLGHEAVATAPDGTFRIATDEPPEADRVTAVAPGHLPATWIGEVDPATGRAAFPEYLELQLGSEALEIAGVVRSESGDPLGGIELWIEDPTEFGTIGNDDLAHLEFLAAPRESTYDPTSDAYFRYVQTDARGRFRIQGLLDRDYTLMLMDLDRMHLHRAGSFAAGRADVEIVLPTRESGAFEGRVVSASGEPVSGARVDLRVHKFGGVSHLPDPVVTDETGAFRFPDVVAEEAVVMVRGESVLPAFQPARRADGPIDVTVEVLCHFKVDLRGTEIRASKVGARDANGTSLSLYDIGANGFFQSIRIGIDGERSSTIGVTEKARSISLYLEGREVASFDVKLVAGELTTLRP
ncbi:MAG: sigma-70 family RNA polymerase sigma factor [Planctomycetota bacterium]